MWRKSSILVTFCHAPLANTVLLKRRHRDLSDGREMCAWSWGALRSSSSVWGTCGLGVLVIVLGGEARLFDIWNCWVRAGWALTSLRCLLPRFACCLGCFLQVQLSCGFSQSRQGLRGRRRRLPQLLCPVAVGGCCGKSPTVAAPRIASGGSSAEVPP